MEESNINGEKVNEDWVVVQVDEIGENGAWRKKTSSLKGKKVNLRHNPLAITYPEIMTGFEASLTIKSEFAFTLGGELCVWLEEKSWPVLLSSLEEIA